ncbi:hypothetical protein C1646_743427 [Rhizophagus diaphanus]|nr:hypothetical protein C1646_743427 [Rhizophagus diaphanus] [Rhizophagus sp. MUCL 43196]
MFLKMTGISSILRKDQHICLSKRVIMFKEATTMKFPHILHEIEHDIEPTHERLFTENNSSNKGRMKADIVGVRLSDNRQVVFLKMSMSDTRKKYVH